MMKASKGIVAVFMVLGLMLSGLAFGYASGDILDFLPAFAKRAKFVNAVAKPFFIVPGVSTPVTITAYIPDADLVADSVQLKDGTAIIGNLTDTGNKVFSLTSNFQRDNGGPIKLSISATFGAVNKTIAQFEIPVLSLPALHDASLYNQNIDIMFSTLVTTKDNFSVLQDPATTSGQSSIHLGLARERLLSVYANMEAIYRAETHSPSNFPRWTTFVPTYGGLLGSADNLLSDRELFKKNPYDPRVAHILAWAQSTFPWDTYLSTPADRETAAWYYQTHGPNAPLQDTLREANKVAIKQAGGQFTGLAGKAIGQLFGGVTGLLVKKAFNASVDKSVDISISNTNEMGLFVGQVQDDEAVELPAGSHDVLFSFGGVLDRAIYRNVLVNSNLTTTLNIAPGETKLCKYSYQDLGAGAGSSARSININGQVVGYFWSQDGNPHAFLWRQIGGLQDLGYIPGIYSSGAYSINNNNDVVGNSGRAFLWNSSDGMKDLGILPDGCGYSCGSTAWGINNNGQIVGDSSATYGTEMHAFLWNSSDGMKDLGTLGGTFSRAHCINDKGYIVGMSWSISGANTAFLWTPSGDMQNLNDLANDKPSGTYLISASCINNNNQIVGWMYNQLSSYDAFLWSASDGLKTLGQSSMAYGINNYRHVVGSGAGGAFLWTPTEGMKYLNNLVVNLPPNVILTLAYSINDAGQIVGVSSEGAFLLTPIP